MPSRTPYLLTCKLMRMLAVEHVTTRKEKKRKEKVQWLTAYLHSRFPVLTILIESIDLETTSNSLESTGKPSSTISAVRSNSLMSSLR